MKPIRLGVYAIIIKENKLLLTQTQAGSQQILNFPGGGVAPSESITGALQRECQEELGCSVLIQNLLYSSQKLFCNPEFPDNYMFHLYYQAIPCSVIEPNIQQAAWYALDELPLQSMLPIDVECITFLIEWHNARSNSSF